MNASASNHQEDGYQRKKSSRDRQKALFISFNLGAYIPFKFNRTQYKTSNSF